VAPAFATSADLAIDKDAGQPCPNLQTDFRCGIHRELRQRGFPGCTAYDCFGAGQRVTQETFAGRDWRQGPQVAAQMFDVFTALRHLHELLWHLTEALTLPPARPLHTELRRAFDATERLADGCSDELSGTDVTAHRRDVAAVLARASELVRRGSGRTPIDRTGADLIGARLRGHDLRGANLRGAYLIGADLGRADLRTADLMGADLRAADLQGADLSSAIFLTRPQLAAAKGDGATRVPPHLERPAHWSTAVPAGHRRTSGKRRRSARPRA
jgi:uncharacterized protein YjbI with pentapeptide repeats